MAYFSVWLTLNTMFVTEMFNHPKDILAFNDADVGKNRCMYIFIRMSIIVLSNESLWKP